MANNKTFRSALNGFNREDVVRYIEYINTQHATQLNQLTAEIELLRSQLETAQPSAVLPDLESELAAAREQLQVMAAQNAQLEEDIQAALNAKYQAELARDAALAQQTEVRSRVEEELEAYRRAERAERLANERAQKVYHRVNGVLADATVKVDGAASQIGALADQVMAQLGLLQDAASSSKDALQEAVETMYALQPTAEE